MRWSFMFKTKTREGDGYVFREVDDWTGIPQNTITKNIPNAAC